MDCIFIYLFIQQTIDMYVLCHQTNCNGSKKIKFKFKECASDDACDDEKCTLHIIHT